MKKILLAICICSHFFMFTSCDRQTNIIDLKSVPLTSLQFDGSFEINQLMSPTNMTIIDNSILFNCANSTSKSAFYLYDKTNGDFRGEYVHFGKAGNEIYWLNPNYIYQKRNQIYVNTNDFFESVYEVEDSNISLLSNNRRITKEIFLSYEKIGDDTFLAKSDDTDKEYLVVTVDGDEISSREVGDYPNCSTDMDKVSHRRMFYINNIVPSESSVYAFYCRIPLIRKYDNHMTLEKEVTIGQIPNIAISQVKDCKAFSVAKKDNDKLYVMFFNNGNIELLVFDTQLKLHNRYEIIDNIRAFDVCEDILYVFVESDKNNVIKKYKLHNDH